MSMFSGDTKDCIGNEWANKLDIEADELKIVTLFSWYLLT